MQNLLLISLTALSYFGAWVSCIWAVIQFILYLAKDIAFNWWCIWSIVIFFALVLCLSIITVIFSSKKEYSKSKKWFE